ncbi:MAG: class I SAM-dependent methyltransferase [Deltaproteobacteria bacterium]|nr:class I SAM-dependent methyltransferase [Deltaproteobacteria bacterium]
MATTTSRTLYNQTADAWVRREADSLSDFTARPRILDLCGNVQDIRVLDLGCGEGYVSRKLRARGAHVIGVDISEEMIGRARQAEAAEPLGIDYRVGDASRLHFREIGVDLVVAVFLFNYLDVEQTRRALHHAHRVLRPGGRLVFAVPHPAFPFISQARRPFYFDVNGAGYFSGRDEQFSGRIWKRSGTPLDVLFVHKTFQDYFEALELAGFEYMPRVEELSVTEEHLALDPTFFEPVADMPLHVAFTVERT